ncbi:MULTISPECIES: hypothetical protein [Streptomyces]|nr:MULTISPECIES: hypothetical protein [Streptomyces]
MRRENLSPGSAHSRADTAPFDAGAVTTRTFDIPELRGVPGSSGAIRIR